MNRDHDDPLRILDGALQADPSRPTRPCKDCTIVPASMMVN